ncbi:hypothetical protein LguiA_014388 [Lonicera macranthoides]
MVLKLFGGSDGSDNDTNDISNIQIDEKFDRRYKHNKKREDLQRLEELKKKGIISDSDSDSEESSEEEVPLDDGKKVSELFTALIKIRNNDPSLKSKEAKLFGSDDDEEEDEQEEDEEENGGKGKGKPMYLKDVTAMHLIKEGADFEEGEEEVGMGVKTYNDEQEEYKRAVLDATAALDGDDDGGELLKMKEGKFDEEDDDGGKTKKKLDEYFGEDDKLDEDSKFLKDFFENKMYLNRDGDGKMIYEDDLGFSQDEEEIEKQEEYERKINFRYEEDAGDRVLGHSRIVSGSVRNKPNARKEQRKRKEERMAQAEFERNEELKRLKNLKKKETKEKLKKIMETGGIGEDGAFALNEDDLEEPFDEQKYDKKMKEMFDEDYYKANDEDPEFGSDTDEDGELEKPDFDKEDELLGLGKGWDDEYGSTDGFLAFRKRKVHSKNEEEVEEGQKKKKCERSSLGEEFIKKELEEYYKLDYEDTIGDLKTRFKYRPVNAKRFGLSTMDVLEMDDKDLNQYLPLKKIAPYREKEWKVPRNKTYSIKHEKKSVHERDGPVRKTMGKNLTNKDKKSTEVVGPSELNGETNKLSRKSKRKQRQAELKLPPSRLMAYGKIPFQHKSKKKKQ